MELYIYDKKIKLIGVLDTYQSLRWRRKYNNVGEFELHLAPTYENIQLLRNSYYIHRLDSIDSAYIETLMIDEANYDVMVKGKLLNGLLSQAVLSKNYDFSTTVNDAMKTIIQMECKRVLPNLILGDFCEDDTLIQAQLSWNTCHECITAMANSAGLGYRLILDVKQHQLVFETYRGIDHSIMQKEHPHVIFDDEFANLDAPVYTFDTVNLKNFAYVVGEKKDEKRIVATLDMRADSQDIKEIYIDASELKQETKDKIYTDAQYYELLLQKGREVLQEHQMVENFDTGITAIGNFMYLHDWDVGDIVTIGKTRWGISLSSRITEVEEVYEKSGVKVYPVIGNPYPDKFTLGGN